VPDPVQVELDDGVATVTVDNPPVNALDDPTLEDLGDAARSLADDERIRAVVLTGAGDRAFLAGADLRSLKDSLGSPGGMDAHVALTRPVFDAWRRLPQPVVAAVGANAVGGGLEFALVCDLIVADPRARFGVPEVTIGLMPGGGGTQRLPRRIGWSATSELLLLGSLIDAERARELGLVNRVSAEGRALEEAAALARRLARLPAVALQSAKRAARLGLEAGLDEGLDAERELFLRVAASDDARAGATAFLEKREPAFRHR
jgi:enoyl-CoA hydratase/carnithine racemase